MDAHPALDLLECLYADEALCWNRATWKGMPLLARRFQTSTRRHLDRERGVTRRLGVAGVAPIVDVVGGEATVVLFDAPRACPLGRAVLPVETALDVAARVAETLADLHAEGAVHCDLSPRNLLWTSETGDVMVTGLGNTQLVSRRQADVHPISTLPLQAHYASPEQTGRMNRAIDARSDLYALGATLYALLVGHPPFTADSLAELLHAHMARRPTPLTELVPNLPEPVSALVDRLLAKRPEDRYQTARGLALDLRDLAERVRGGGALETFRAGAHDHDGKLQLPERLYGREGETMLLRRSFEDAARGENRVLLVSGYSGIGKTSLVREVVRSLDGLNANFVSGKLDQFERTRPYASILQGLQGQVVSILTQCDEEVAAWRKRILDQLGESGASVLVDVMPVLSLVVGDLRPAETLAPAEARNRFRTVVARFVRALASAESPLIVFLDDLQWADLASIELITHLATDPESRHVLFVGAYRDNEVDHAHPLTTAIESMRRDGARLAHIELRPLSLRDTTALLHDALGGAEGIEVLARLCLDKTGGNAFFLRHFLTSLHETGLLAFENDGWRWDAAAVAALPVTLNVVDFVTRRLRSLPPQTRRTLGAAAAIGDEVELGVLAFALELAPSTVLEVLDTPLAALLIHPVGDTYWALESLDDDAALSLRFAHDRIRQSARALIDPDEAIAIRLAVGRHLLAEAEQTGARFDIVNHLNAAAARIDDPAERSALASLNIDAARRAGAAAAFGAADQYYAHARACLGERAWDESYPRALEAWVSGARAAWLGGDDARSSALVDRALAKTVAPLDRIQAHEVRIGMLAGRQQLIPSMQLALDVLRELGVDLELAPSQAAIEARVAATVQRLFALGADAESVLARGPATDASFVAAARLQNHIMASAYLAAPALLPMLACTIVDGTLEHGVCPESPYGFAVLALVLSIAEEIDVAFHVGQLALALLDTFDNRAIRPKPLHVVHSMVAPFVTPLVHSVAQERAVFELAMDTGDMEYAGWGLHMMVCNGFFAGLSLHDFADVVGQNVDVLEHYGQGPSLACTRPFRQAVHNLRDPMPFPTQLVGPDYDEDAHFEELVALGFRGGAYVCANLGAAIRCLYGDFDGALERGKIAAEYADGAPSTYHVVWWHQFRGLAWLGRVDSTSSAGVRAAAVEGAAPHLAHLRKLERFSPVNHAHRVALLEGETARVEGRLDQAVSRLRSAVDLARENGFLHDAALAAERAGTALLEAGHPAIATPWFEEAHTAWLDYGADARAAWLARHVAPAITIGATGGTRGEPSFAETLDALARRRRKPERAEFLDLALRASGATRAALVVRQGDGLVVAASVLADGEPAATPATLDEAGLPEPLVTYAIRSAECIVCDASPTSRWSELAGPNPPPSAVLVPIRIRSEVCGALYLENTLVEGAFSDALLPDLEAVARQLARVVRRRRR